MKSKILRICISFLTVLMVFISLPVMNASAEEKITSDGIMYEISGGEVAITDYTGNAKNLTIPSSIDGYPVTSIGEHAFDSCDSLTSIEIPEGVTSIGERSFNLCDSLTSIEIPSSVTSIGEGAFYLCDSLTSITIPSSVMSIGDSAFWWCSSLTSIEIPEGVTSIGSRAFSDCSALKRMVVDKNNPVYDSRDNCNAIIETATNILIAGCSKTEIPSSVTSIGEGAFYLCDSLTSITIPSSVTSIGDSAFSGCSALERMVVDKNNPVYDSRDNCNAIIKTATNTLIAGCSKTEIPSSVTSIGNRAFFVCTSLTSIEIPEGVTSIGSRAFSDCYSLTSITIPSAVTSIGKDAFYYCGSLTSITIPSSVTSIGEGAFSYCDSLSDVYYEGGDQEWNSITVGEDNELFTEANIHFNSEMPKPQTEPQTEQESEQKTESKSEAESEEKVSSGMKILGFIGIALIVSAVLLMWVVIVKKVYKNKKA